MSDIVKPVGRGRWLQLAFGVVCMCMIANMQYGWTFFVSPMQERHGWDRAAIQVAFTLFVVTETWLVPIEGWFVDKYGPRIVTLFGGLLCAIAWVINSYADSLDRPVHRGRDRRHRCGRGLWDLRRQLTEVVSRPPRACRRHHRDGLRRRLGADRRADPGDDQGAGLRGGLLLLRHRPGRHRDADRPVPAVARQGAGSGGRTGQPVEAATTSRPRWCAPPIFWVMYAMFVMMAAGGLMATAQLGPIAKDFKIADVPVSLLGITLPALTFAATLDRVLNGVTRPFFGWVSDHIGRENTMFLSFAIEGVRHLRAEPARPQPDRLRAADWPGVLRLGRDLLAVPGDLRRHLRVEIRGHQCRPALYRQGHGGPDRALYKRAHDHDG